MNPDQSLRAHSGLLRLVRSAFPDNPAAPPLLDRFLHSRRDYDRGFVEFLLAVAGSPTAGEPALEADRAWEIRRLAAFMLQQQFLLLPAGEVEESLPLLGHLGLLVPGQAPPRLRQDVLQEGYMTAEPAAFLREFRRHLGRMNRVLRPLGRARVSCRACEDFLLASREDCKVALARYLFSPDEVAERIFSQVRRSAGEAAPFHSRPARKEACQMVAALSRFESGLVRALRKGQDTFWAGEQSGSRLNALVEQPLGTVVLTVKPPGSCLEIEIKRAGRRSDLPLRIVHDRDGRPVPPSHRLDGGSTADKLQWEASGAARLGRIYRLVHGTDAPISVTVCITYPNKLPVGGGLSRHLIDYFSDPNVLGNEFEATQKTLRQAVDSFARESDDEPLRLQGDWGAALEFFQYAVPAQSLLIGTSSFRIDLLARYLSAEGPTHYFKDGQAQPAPAEVRRFADAVLEEVLGTFVRPGRRPGTHDAYVDAVFARPENRARAERVHASLTRQLGTFWGTLLALRVHSFGESVVARNVGLKWVWRRGRWRPRILFMDHDNLHLPPAGGRPFDPLRVLPGMVSDETHLTGRVLNQKAVPGTVDHLGAIYRVGEATASRHLGLLGRAMARAYRRTQQRLRSSPALARMISLQFIKTSQAWDCAVAVFLRRPGAVDWPEEAEALLRQQGLPADLVQCFLTSIEHFAPFLKRHAYLFLDEAAADGPPEARGQR
jgi:hypothetical protein